MCDSEVQELTLRLPARTCAELEARAQQHDLAPGELVSMMLSILELSLSAESCPVCALREAMLRG